MTTMPTIPPFSRELAGRGGAPTPPGSRPTCRYRLLHPGLAFAAPKNGERLEVGGAVVQAYPDHPGPDLPRRDRLGGRPRIFDEPEIGRGAGPPSKQVP